MKKWLNGCKNKITMSTSELDILNENAELCHLRNWNEYEVELYPLILKRSPTTYFHQCSCFIVPTNHPQYSHLMKKIRYWLMDIPEGKKINADMTARLDWDDITPKCWYTIDFREVPDATLPNQIVLKNFDKLAPHAQNRLAFELYEKVKGLVIFADHYSQIPAVWTTLSAWGLTSNTSLGLTNFLKVCINQTPNNAVVYKTDDKLAGFNKFGDVPVFCYL